MSALPDLPKKNRKPNFKLELNAIFYKIKQRNYNSFTQTDDFAKPGFNNLPLEDR
jgi:hypothetical protein